MICSIEAYTDKTVTMHHRGEPVEYTTSSHEGKIFIHH